MDLIREILLDVEANLSFPYGKQIEITGHSEEEVKFHIYLLRDAGLVYVADGFLGNNPLYVNSLTWHGCEFLEAAKDNTRWNETKKQLGKVGANVFEIMFRVLVESAMKEITRG